MATVPTPPETTYSWRDICERVDGPNRHLESLYPVVYYWESGAYRRDSGPMSGIYAPGIPPVGPTDIDLSNNVVQEQVLGAPVGDLTVIGPPVPYSFVVKDLTDPAITWTVDNGLLRLAPGVQIFFDAGQPFHTVEIKAIAPNNLFVIVDFPITVQQIIVPPPPNHAPTDITMSNLTLAGSTPGALVGTYTVVDVDLPNDTETITISDPRFIAVPSIVPGVGTIQLAPAVQIDAALEPMVTVTIRATDSGALFVDKIFVFAVTSGAPSPAGFSTGFSLGFSS